MIKVFVPLGNILHLFLFHSNLKDTLTNEIKMKTKKLRGQIKRQIMKIVIRVHSWNLQGT